MPASDQGMYTKVVNNIIYIHRRLLQTRRREAGQCDVLRPRPRCLERPLSAQNPKSQSAVGFLNSTIISAGGLLSSFGGSNSGDPGRGAIFNYVQIYQPHILPSISAGGVVSASASRISLQFRPARGLRFTARISPDTRGWTLADFSDITAPTLPAREARRYPDPFRCRLRAGLTPNIPAGQLVQQLNTLSLPFQLSIGCLPANLSYGGLARNFTGLYQFNVTVPSASPGNAALTFTLNGVSGTRTLYVAVGN